MASKCRYRFLTVTILVLVIYINHHIIVNLWHAENKWESPANVLTSDWRHNNRANNRTVKPSTTRPKIFHWDAAWSEYAGVNCHPRKGFVLQRLAPPVDAFIYTYPVVLDTVISKSIAQFGTWESDVVLLLRHILSIDRDYVFVDGGANIGVFTVAAAVLGNHVVAVDCLLENVEHLCATLMNNNLVENVTLVFNAISDNNAQLTIFRNPANIGGTYVSEERSEEFRPSISAVTLDNLLDVYNFSRRHIVVKLDLETFEDKALRGGWLFFHRCSVDYVIVEVSYHEDKETGTFIGEFLRGQGMLPMATAPFRLHKNMAVWKRKGIHEKIAMTTENPQRSGIVDQMLRFLSVG